MSELTARMMFSSLFGYIALGASVAAFLPAIITSAVNRRSPAGPGFLAVWFLADIMFIYGHDDLKWRPPQQSTAFARIQNRKRRPWYHALTLQFQDFSVWDDVKLLAFCVAGGVACWGIYMMLGLYANPEEFAVEIPEGYHAASFWLGMGGIGLFTGARIPEFLSGRARSKREEKPIHSLTDALWWFLIFENFFNLGAILTLSTKTSYLLAQTPFLLGAVLPICFDGIMLAAVTQWQNRWKKLDTPAARQAKEDEATKDQEIELLDQERADILTEAHLKEILADVEAEIPTVSATARGKEKRKAEALRRKIEAAQANFRANETAIRKIENEVATRRKAAAQRHKVAMREEQGPLLSREQGSLLAREDTARDAHHSHALSLGRSRRRSVRRRQI
ncbi:hypothetical protein JCM10908_001712 [Rhodotorula pacifica]|uniref:uncharacterized protein n=1 Tax=Rhodotorula pacifica TaxID=1495444 RepID=UPI003171CDB4